MTHLATAIALAGLVAACGQKAPEAPAPAAPAAVEQTPAPAAEQPAPPPEAAAVPAPDPGQVAAQLAMTPEGLEALLAPIALYPDAVLAHVLTAATNPQMVLDAGNWLIANPGLSGRELDQAAQPLGFSPSMRALLQFPEVVDMMCMQLEWTTQLGEAFLADQAGTLDAVQRLRLQATEVGNLASSEQLTVATELQDERQVITVAPTNPQVVYVPQYDPVAVYAPPPAVVPAPTAAPAPAEPAKKAGYSTGTLITTGLLSFGAGLLVAEIFDDDDDWDDYRPNYGYGGIYYGGRPYYPPPPAFYRPVYGNGFRPGYDYARPPNYQHGFNNNVIVVNNQGNDYWNNFNGGPGSAQTRPASPITSARPDRAELRDTSRQERPARPVPAADDKRAGWQGQSTYAGAKDRAREPAAAAAQRANPAGYAKAGAAQAGPASTDRAREAAAANAARARPAPQGSVDRGRDERPQRADAGANARPAANRPAQPAQSRPEARPAQRPAQQPEQRPAQRPAQQPAQRPAQQPQQRRSGGNGNGGAQPSSFGGPTRGGNDRAASERGRSSMPEGARSRGATPKRQDNQRPGR